MTLQAEARARLKQEIAYIVAIQGRANMLGALTANIESKAIDYLRLASDLDYTEASVSERRRILIGLLDQIEGNLNFLNTYKEKLLDLVGEEKQEAE